MEYIATFGIDGGISSGFGVKYPDFYKRTEYISVDNNEVAYLEAMNKAREFADDHLSKS